MHNSFYALNAISFFQVRNPHRYILPFKITLRSSHKHYITATPATTSSSNDHHRGARDGARRVSGTASMLSSPDGPFINLARLNLAKYAREATLAKPLFEYIFYHENDVRHVSRRGWCAEVALWGVDSLVVGVMGCVW